MKNIIGTYKGYEGSYEYDPRSNKVWGKILFINSLITYESIDGTPDSLRNEFEASVDDYLQDCIEEGITPDKPAKGNFNVRISPELHRKALIHARGLDINLNDLVKTSISEYLENKHVETIKSTLNNALEIHSIITKPNKTAIDWTQNADFFSKDIKTFTKLKYRELSEEVLQKGVQ